jgi:hypothetical protein
MITEGYCVKCKLKVQIKDPIESTTTKGTRIAKGKCAAADAGKIYYNGGTKKHYGCNSTDWNALY